MIQFFKSILSLFNTLRIPTLLGLSIIFLGIGAGIVLVSQEQLLNTQASIDPKPLETPILTNIQDQSVTISWKTADPATGVVIYGQSSQDDLSALDDRDIADSAQAITQPRTDHYVTIRRLAPHTKYQYRIKSGDTIFPEIREFTTASSSINTTSFTPVIGSVTYNDQPLTSGIAYIKIPGGVTQSALVSILGSFTIPLSQVYKIDLTEILPLTETTSGELTVSSQYGISTATLFLSRLERPIGPLKIGENLDLTFLPQIEIPKEEIKTDLELLKFDLNGDKFINSADESIIKKNFGKSPEDPRANLDGIGDVDQTDLDLMRGKIRDKNAGK